MQVTGGSTRRRPPIDWTGKSRLSSNRNVSPPRIPVEPGAGFLSPSPQPGPWQGTGKRAGGRLNRRGGRSAALRAEPERVDGPALRESSRAACSKPVRSGRGPPRAKQKEKAPRRVGMGRTRTAEVRGSIAESACLFSRDSPVSARCWHFLCGWQSLSNIRCLWIKLPRPRWTI